MTTQERGRPLQVGDTVEYLGSRSGTRGIVIEQIGEQHLRVQWPDLATALVHPRKSLRLGKDAR
jgi:hypothetical protein